MSELVSTNRPATAGGASTVRDSRATPRSWVTNAAVRLGVTEATIRRWIRSGRLNPSCREVYAQVFPYLDHELGPEELAEVERHIAACPGCEEHFAFDGTVLRFVRQRVPRSLCPPNLHDRLLAPFKGRAAESS
jgi:mycothiol system anti-sigma-R factor